MMSNANKRAVKIEKNAPDGLRPRRNVIAVEIRVRPTSEMLEVRDINNLVDAAPAPSQVI
jgi:hypothetical protein